MEAKINIFQITAKAAKIPEPLTTNVPLAVSSPLISANPIK